MLAKTKADKKCVLLHPIKPFSCSKTAKEMLDVKAVFLQRRFMAVALNLNAILSTSKLPAILPKRAFLLGPRLHSVIIWGVEVGGEGGGGGGRREG